ASGRLLLGRGAVRRRRPRAATGRVGGERGVLGVGGEGDAAAEDEAGRRPGAAAALAGREAVLLFACGLADDDFAVALAGGEPVAQPGAVVGERDAAEVLPGEEVFELERLRGFVRGGGRQRGQEQDQGRYDAHDGTFAGEGGGNSIRASVRHGCR